MYVSQYFSPQRRKISWYRVVSRYKFILTPLSTTQGARQYKSIATDSVFADQAVVIGIYGALVH
jgi:hypothetical protein